MINKIRLKDFQSHKDSTFNLVKGINVISAGSGTGKSAVIRALNYLFTNKKPSNVKYERRPDCKEFEISIDVDGHTIKRVKGTKVNEYHIDNEVYKDIGVNVPDKVFTLTKIQPIKVGTDEYNVQLAKQFDPHFLMFLPDSSKVKFLNRLSGGHILDMALKETNKDLSQMEKDKANNQIQCDQLNNKINNITSVLSPIKAVIIDVKEKYNSLQEVVQRVMDLKKLYSQLQNYLTQKQEFDKMSYVLSKVNVDGFEFKVERLKNLRNIFNQYTNVKKEISNCIDKMLRLKDFNVKNMESKVNRLQNLYQLNSTYLSVKADIDKNNAEIKYIDASIDSMINQVQAFLEANPKCPSCGSSITKTKIEKIIKELK